MVNLGGSGGLTCGLLLALVGATVLVAPATRAAVIWTFFETSCTAFNGPTAPFNRQTVWPGSPCPMSMPAARGPASMVLPTAASRRMGIPISHSK